MRSLLDVSVLLALLDEEHIRHKHAQEWMAAHGESGWASCSITQNGFLRVISQPRYTNPFTIYEAQQRLREAVIQKYHQFWLCNLSFLDADVVDHARVYGHRQVTDTYLLALAVQNSARFVTFDRSVGLNSVRGALPQNLVVI